MARHPLDQPPLATWPISDKGNKCKVFLRELSTCIFSLGDHTHAHIKTQPGKRGIAGELEDKPIHYELMHFNFCQINLNWGSSTVL